MVNYSNKFKYVWWGIGACGSGTMSTILKDEFDLLCESSSDDCQLLDDYTISETSNKELIITLPSTEFLNEDSTSD